MVLLQGDVAFDEPNNVAHVVALIAFVDHGNGDAFASSTSGAANAMHVRFADVGDLEVDDVTDAFDIDATGRNVRGHKHANLAFAEGVHRLFTLGLALVPVNGFASDVVFLQVAHHLVRAVFGAGEDQGGLHFLLIQQLDEQVALGALADKHHALFHRFCSTADAGHFHADGVGQDGLRQFDNAFRHGGAEKQALSLLGKHGHHATNVVDEPHVEHGVRLIQDQKLNPLQRQQALVAQVEQTAGCGYEDVGAFAELGHLLVLADPTKNQRRPHLDVLGVGLDVVVDLGGELTGGGEDQDPRHSAAVHHVVGEVVHQGQRERGGFARTCLGDAHDISAVEDVGNRLFLNGGGLLVTERNEGFEHPRVQAHVRKFH